MNAPLLLHVFPGFGPGGTQLRTVATLNALGARYRHIVLALNGDLSAAALFAPGLDWSAAPEARGYGPLRGLVRATRPDLLLTYNWGAFDAIVAATLPARLCPVVHNECGFGPDETERRVARRCWARRLVLPRVYRTVTVSAVIEKIALTEFGVPRSRLARITTGVDTSRFRPGDGSEMRSRWGIASGEMVFGYVGGLRPEKDVATMVRAFHAAAVPEARLVLVGDGPDRAALEALAAELGIAARVLFAGALSDPSPCYRAFDVFTLSSATEGLPNAVLEAMSSALPVAATAVGDCPELLGPDAAAVTAPARDPEGLGGVYRRLAHSAELRARLGAANRARVEALYSFEKMTAAYARLWDAAIAAR